MILSIDKTDWKPTKLGEVAFDVNDRVDNPSTSGYDRFVGLEHFVSGDLKIINWGTTENLVSAMKMFKAGDVLFARRNAHLRRASMVNFDGVCSGDAFVLRENHKKIVPGFLAFILNTDNLWDYAIANAAGTMSKRVKWRDLAEYEFFLPPKDQQAKIAELLWAFYNATEKVFTLRRYYDSFIVSSLNSLYWDQLGYSKMKSTNFGYIPDTWELEMLDNLCIKIGDGIHKAPNYVNNSKYYFINGNNLIGNKIVPNERTKFVSRTEFEKYTKKLELGSILMSINGTIGNLAFYRGEEVVLGKSVAFITVDKKVLDPLYLYYLLQTNKIRKFYNRELTGSTISNLSLKTIRATPVPYPSIEIQKKISIKVQNIFRVQDKLEENTATYKTLQNSLMKEIISI